MRKILACVVSGLLTIAMAGCHHDAPPPAAVDYKLPLPDGMVALRKIPLEEYPNFTLPLDVVALKDALNNSLIYLDKQSSKSYFPYLDITHERAIATCQRMIQMCDQIQGGLGTNQAWLNQEIRQHFDVYKSIGAPRADGTGYTDRVLFTGYFTPIYDASMTKTDQFQWPLYRAPDDLARDPVTLEAIGRRQIDGTVVPYYTRAEIETGQKLAGHELVWLRTRWEAYVITIQGSARLRLPDKTIYEVGYAGTNGYAYTSPGQQMLADGVITKDQLSLKGLKAYFEAHPEAMDKYLAINKRFVFFTERPGGPFGSLNTRVTPLASIATDKANKDIYPRAMPAFVMTLVQSEASAPQTFNTYMMDQDTGGAIRASGRADLYMGVGPYAEGMAGRELQEGSLYYLAVKDIPATLAPGSAGRD